MVTQGLRKRLVKPCCKADAAGHTVEFGHGKAIFGENEVGSDHACQLGLNAWIRSKINQ